MAVRASGTRARARALLVWSVVFALLTTCCAVDVGKSSGKSSGKLTDKLCRKMARGGKTCAKRDLGAHSDLARHAEEAAASEDCERIPVELAPGSQEQVATHSCQVLEGFLVKTNDIKKLQYPGIDSCVTITIELANGEAVGAHFVITSEAREYERNLFNRLIEAVPAQVQVKKVYVDGSLMTWFANTDSRMDEDYFPERGENHGSLTSAPKSTMTHPDGTTEPVDSCPLMSCKASFEFMFRAKFPNNQFNFQWGDCQGDLEVQANGEQDFKIYFKKNRDGVVEDQGNC